MNESGFRERLRLETGPVRLDLPWATAMPRFIQPIKHAGHVVGCLWAIRESADLSDGTAEVVREFAEMLGPDLAEINQRSADGPGGRVLSQVLSGVLPASSLAELLESDEAGTEVVMLAVEAPTGDRSATTRAVAARTDATRALTLYARLQLPSALVTSEQEVMYVLMAAPAISDRVLDGALDGISTQLRSAVDAAVLTAAGGCYRLRRIEESAGVRLSDPQTRLALELVLRAGDG